MVNAVLLASALIDLYYAASHGRCVEVVRVVGDARDSAFTV